MSKIYNLFYVMTVFSSPAYATMLSNRDVLIPGQRAKAFTVHLPVPVHLTPSVYLLTLWLDFVADHPCFIGRVSVSPLSLFLERGGGTSGRPSKMMIHAIHSQFPL